MKTTQTRQLAVSLTALLAFPALGADQTADWANVETLRHGARIGVLQADQKRVEGRFESVSASAIVLDSGGVLSIDRDKVVRVYKAGASRRKRMLIGAAVGLAAGATVAATVSRRLNNEGFFGGSNGGAGAAAAVGGGAGIGLALGSLGGDGYQTIYQKQGGR